MSLPTWGLGCRFGCGDGDEPRGQCPQQRRPQLHAKVFGGARKVEGDAAVLAHKVGSGGGAGGGAASGLRAGGGGPGGRCGRGDVAGGRSRGGRGGRVRVRVGHGVVEVGPWSYPTGCEFKYRIKYRYPAARRNDETCGRTVEGSASRVPATPPRIVRKMTIKNGIAVPRFPMGTLRAAAAVRPACTRGQQ